MKAATPPSAYDSASSRAQAPQSGAALKSSRIGRPFCFAWPSVESTSLLHEIAMARFYIGRHADTSVECWHLNECDPVGGSNCAIRIRPRMEGFSKKGTACVPLSFQDQSQSGTLPVH